MAEWVQAGLQKWKDDGQIEKVHPVSGGDINEAYYVRTSNNEYFVKRNKHVELSFFQLEEEGLRKINETETIDVPFVYGVMAESNTPMLWLEWVEGDKNEYTDSWLGERLAAMHMSKADSYGYSQSTFIGRLEQKNALIDSWITYYRDYRLIGQLELGKKNGLITGKREEMFVRLLENLEKWLPNDPKPSLLHGDLWGGNWITGMQGKPYLVDPSVFYGDNEMEMAFTELFGGFSKRFYEAYQSIFPLSSDYSDRKDLYQLYYLLVHLNMFGEMYGSSVDRILKKYIK